MERPILRSPPSSSSAARRPASTSPTSSPSSGSGTVPRRPPSPTGLASAGPICLRNKNQDWATARCGAVGLDLGWAHRHFDQGEPDEQPAGPASCPVTHERSSAPCRSSPTGGGRSHGCRGPFPDAACAAVRAAEGFDVQDRCDQPGPGIILEGNNQGRTVHDGDEASWSLKAPSGTSLDEVSVNTAFPGEWAKTSLRWTVFADGPEGR